MIDSRQILEIARRAGFELAGITPAVPSPDLARYQTWVERGMAGEMKYLTDRRADVRADPRNLLPSAKSILCLGKLYNTAPQKTDGPISRYAWGLDYHDVLRPPMEAIIAELGGLGESFEYKICIDTAPLLERSYARAAGLGWIGKNTCLINQEQGSWFFLAEILLSLELEAVADVAPDRCGTCTSCIDACPTAALEPYELDARKCISYLTIELKGPIPEDLRAGVGHHVFGCDICQEVCPWNGRAGLTEDPAFQARKELGPDADLLYLSASDIRLILRGSPARRAKLVGFLRNLAVAMGNQRSEQFRQALLKLTESTDGVVAEHARWALFQLDS